MGTDVEQVEAGECYYRGARPEYVTVGNMYAEDFIHSISREVSS